MTLTDVKTATTDHPVHKLISTRWSPYAFDGRPVPAEDLRSLFEAARWAASSLNEQPWTYIVATKENPEEFAKLLSCLVEGNQKWAHAAPVLALGVTHRYFNRNGRENGAAVHDLGLASANLTVEATARGLYVHQMLGIEPQKARAVYGIPEGWDALTALAIGYLGDPASLPDALRARDETPRTRRPLAEFVYGRTWGESSPLVAEIDGGV